MFTVLNNTFLMKKMCIGHKTEVYDCLSVLYYRPLLPPNERLRKTTPDLTFLKVNVLAVVVRRCMENKVSGQLRHSGGRRCQSTINTMLQVPLTSKIVFSASLSDIGVCLFTLF